ncbi:MAG TPA: universal stress protein [Candidatus Dormibacteraeota bacterium]|nr:universal stress protein [Candidatus Dormibacteraeota bacterium]
MNVLLAIDESEFSRATTREVIAHIPVSGTRVCVLHVVEPIWYVGGEPLGAIEQLEAVHTEAVEHGKRLVEQAEKALREAGFEVTSLVAEGDPRATIVDQAETQKADLIVLGSHGRRGWRRLVLGSVSESVARYAPCSVQIVRAPAAAKSD